MKPTPFTLPDPDWTLRLQDALVGWYGQCARQLPWRETRDPYAIWVSEIMLQQTQVDTVIPYYLRFLAALPDVTALAEAPEELLLKLWEGLGYYSRARNLQKAARMVIEHHDGRLPADTGALEKLPGIGLYTAGAIASIAFGLPEPAVDGNVIRVYSRLLGIAEDAGAPAGKKLFQTLGRHLTDPRDPSSYNQAVMELGATVCTPQKPSCENCPVSGQCAARVTGTQASYPVKAAKTPPRIITWQVICLWMPGRLFLVPGSNRLLKGLWALPMLAADSPLPELRLESPPLPVGSVKHVFTHQVWQMALFSCRCSDPETALSHYPEGRWVDSSTLSELPVSTAFRKALKQVLTSGITL